MFSSGTFICLRCQTRLLRNRANRPLTVPTPRSTFSSALRRRAPEDEASEPRPSRHATADEPAPIRFTIGKGNTIDGDVHASFASERRLLGKVRGKRGGEVREGSAALSIDSLGEKAEVIILRDAGFEHREVKGEGEEEEEAAQEDLSPQRAKLSQEAILKSIEDAKVELDQDSVNAQIDGLRPAHSVSLRGINAQLSKKEYDKLCKVLQKSFSVPQLRGYCKTKRVELLKEAEEKKRASSGLNVPTEKEITLAWSPWKVGTTTLHTRPARRMVNAVNLRISERNHSKEKLIWHIIRTFWKVDVADNADAAIGELEFKLKSHELSLFTAGNPSCLMEIGQKQQAKLEVYSEQNIVRITADKTTAMEVLENFDDLRSSIISRRIDVRSVPIGDSSDNKNNDKYKAKSLFKEDITKISNMTRTAIVINKDSSLTIWGTNEDSIFDARRAIYGIIASPIKVVIKSVKEKNWPHNCFLQPVSTLDGLPYRERRDDYGRVSLPTNSLGVTEEKYSDGSDMSTTSALEPEIGLQGLDGHPSDGIMKNIKAHFLEQIKFIQPETPKHSAVATTERADQPSDTNDQQLVPSTQVPGASSMGILEQIWSHQAEITISATVGQVLHRTPTSTTLKCASIPTDFRSTAFLRTLPNMTEVLTRLPELSQSKTGSDILSFRLFQDLWSSKDTFLLPEIRMDFKVNPLSEKTRTAELVRMYAVLDPHTAHVMLPSRAVDLSLDWQLTIPMSLDAIEASEVLGAYVEKTKQNIEGGGRLRAPHILRLPIPSWMAFKNKKRSTGQKKPEVVMGNYFFAGVEHRETLSFEAFPSPFLLSYNSIEAGQMGGRYGELTLQAPQQFKTLDDARNMAMLLVRKAFGFVDFVDAAVQGKSYAADAKQKGKSTTKKNKKKAKRATIAKTMALGNGEAAKASEQDEDGQGKAMKNEELTDEPVNTEEIITTDAELNSQSSSSVASKTMKSDQSVVPSSMATLDSVAGFLPGTQEEIISNIEPQQQPTIQQDIPDEKRVATG